MAGITRRAFLSTTAALAAAWSLPKEALGAVLAAPLKPATDAPTTLLQTIRHSSQVTNKQYRTLVSAPGDPVVPRLDVLQKDANPARARNRRSLLYIGHLTDIHVIDPQSPARLDAMTGQSASLWAGAIHPQDTLTVNVMAAMADAITAARVSPLTGAPMAAAVNTGDSADQHSDLELKWYIESLDGAEIVPNSGKPGEYEGPQAWAEATYAYHPDNPDGDIFGAYGYPTIPGLLTAAVSQTVTSKGIPIPWYAVFGNHDTLLNGVIPIDAAMRSFAVGNRKAVEWEALADSYLRGMATDGSAFTKFTTELMTKFGINGQMKTVTADPARKLFEQQEFMQAHFDTKPVPGPIGHGFTQHNLDTGETWWSADLSPHFRVFGLDTCNQTAGPDGAVPEDQFNWLKAGLQRAHSENKMAIVLSHHNSTTLENNATPVTGGQRLIHADEFIAMLQEFPNMVAWVNGHTHINTITAHPKSGGGGFWEITAASCIDYPQQQQLIEFVDNRDGTMSIFTTTIDHLSPPQWREGDFSQVGMASLSRELAANDWIENPPMRVGSPLDRNCELLLPAPFDLSRISDADLDRQNAANQARLMAFEKGQAQ